MKSYSGTDVLHEKKKPITCPSFFFAKKSVRALLHFGRNLMLKSGKKHKRDRKVAISATKVGHSDCLSRREIRLAQSDAKAHLDFPIEIIVQFIVLYITGSQPYTNLTVNVQQLRVFDPLINQAYFSYSVWAYKRNDQFHIELVLRI